MKHHRKEVILRIISIIDDVRKKEPAEPEHKIALSVYVSSEVVKKLEEARVFCSRTLSPEKRRGLTESQFYELILENVISNYAAFGENSNLWKLIKDWADE